MTSESPANSTVEEASTPTQSKTPMPKHVFEGHESRIWSIVFLHDNVHIVSGSLDGTMRKWNCDTGLLVGESWKWDGRGVYALALSPDGKTIACGRQDGSVQRWNTDGEMIEGVWTGHRKWVRSLAWSPSGSHLASGSEDGTILIRKAESGEIDVGPIKTGQGFVFSLAYSPLGDRIASGGQNETICIWDSKTGELVVGPITGLIASVTSLVWSSDGTKLYSASDRSARVFDSVSGAELHRFEHTGCLYSVALSPTGNVLACAGIDGIAQLWDTETHQKLGEQLAQEKTLHCGSFSRDGRYLACGGDDKKITLWMVDEIAPGLAESASTTLEDAPPEEIRSDSPESSPSSYLDRDAKNPRARPGDHEGEGSADPYKNFFRSSKTSLALAPSGSLPLHRRFWAFVIPSRHRPPEENSLPPKEKRHKRSLFRRRARSKSPLRVPATTDYSEGKVQEGEHVEERRNDVNCPAKSAPDAGKGKQRNDPLADVQTPPSDDSSPPAEEHDDQSDFQSSTPSGPFRRHAPGNESISLHQRPKPSFFARHSGPRPVTIYAARPKKWYYTARGKNRNADKKNGNTHAQTGQSSSAVAHSSSAAQPHPTTHIKQQPQAQVSPETHPASARREESAQSHSTALNQQQHQAQTQPADSQRENSDLGSWGNFRVQVALALCCIPRGAHIVSGS